jgi:hypothetical protein
VKPDSKNLNAFGEKRTIFSGLILGLGDVEVTVCLRNAEAAPIIEKTSAKLYLFYIKM